MTALGDVSEVKKTEELHGQRRRTRKGRSIWSNGETDGKDMKSKF